jgi:hypothetical protein
LSDVPDIVAGIPMSAGYRREYRVPKYGAPVNSYRSTGREEEEEKEGVEGG